jgi:hypothetical protein
MRLVWAVSLIAQILLEINFASSSQNFLRGRVLPRVKNIRLLRMGLHIDIEQNNKHEKHVAACASD